jgi:hypothetical protein
LPHIGQHGQSWTLHRGQGRAPRSTTFLRRVCRDGGVRSEVPATVRSTEERTGA